jgi:plasmid stabilization system protein ParE
MTLRWHGEAVAEVEAAAAFYKEKQPSLAQRFLDELDDALYRIQRHPQSYREIERGIRKCRVHHFPYGIVYRAQSDFIQIIAVMHLRRSPGHWKYRA